MTSHVEVSGNLVAKQNPASGEKVAEEVYELLQKNSLNIILIKWKINILLILTSLLIIVEYNHKGSSIRSSVNHSSLRIIPGDY